MAVATTLAIVFLTLCASAALGQEPLPTSIVPVDPRTGPVPSSTGSAGLALLVTLGLGLAAFIVTVIAVRLLPRGR